MRPILRPARCGAVSHPQMEVPLRAGPTVYRESSDLDCRGPGQERETSKIVEGMQHFRRPFRFEKRCLAAAVLQDLVLIGVEHGRVRLPA
jgi:hypothetical protein